MMSASVQLQRNSVFFAVAVGAVRRCFRARHHDRIVVRDCILRLLVAPSTFGQRSSHREFSSCPDGTGVSTQRRRQHQQQEGESQLQTHQDEDRPLRRIGTPLLSQPPQALRDQPRYRRSKNYNAGYGGPFAANKRKRKHFLTYEELSERTNQLIGVLRVRQHQEDEGNEAFDKAHLRPNTSVIRLDDYFDALEAWMELSAHTRHGIDAAHRAHELLRAMEEAQLESDPPAFVPTLSFYHVVLQAYAFASKERNPQAAQAAQGLLEDMLRRCRQHNLASRNRTATHSTSSATAPSPEPNTKTFNIVINSWARSLVPDAGSRAEDVATAMEEWRRESRFSRSRHCQVDEGTIAGIFSAWTRSKHRNAPERCMELLHEVVESKLNGVEGGYDSFPCVDLDIVVLNTAIQSWVFSGRGREASQKAEDILHMANQLTDNGLCRSSPNSRTYALVLEACVACEAKEKSGDAAERAQRILNAMVRQYSEGTIDTDLLNIVSFTLCMKAWEQCASNRSDAPERAEEIFQCVCNLYEETNDQKFRPDQHAGNTLIATWCAAADRPDSLNRALLALRMFEKYDTPDRISYQLLIAGLGKRRQGVEAVELLYRLERANSFRPNTRTYNMVLAALARDTRKEAANLADQIFQRMESLNGIRPDKFSFTNLIDTLKLSSSTGIARRAHTLVSEMEKRYQAGDANLKPDAYLFAVAIKACAHEKGSRDDQRVALDLAFEMLQSAELSGCLNHMVFSTLMMAIKWLANDKSDQTKLMKSAFEKCCETGLLSDLAVVSLRQATPELLPKEFDPEWSRNVAMRNQPR